VFETGSWPPDAWLDFLDFSFAVAPSSNVRSFQDPTNNSGFQSSSSQNQNSSTSHTPNRQVLLYHSDRIDRAYWLCKGLFICGVCGEFYTNPNDCKGDEGLYLGTEKSVCRGKLKDGKSWGCGRRFADEDAIRQHFHRGSGGRVCIKPLLLEEISEPSSPPKMSNMLRDSIYIFCSYNWLLWMAVD
jgi:hypothetical protein